MVYHVYKDRGINPAFGGGYDEGNALCNAHP